MASDLAARKFHIETFKSELATLDLSLNPQQLDDLANMTVDAGYYHVKDVLRFTESKWINRVFLTPAFAHDVVRAFLRYW